MIRAFPLLALGLGLAAASGTTLALRSGPAPVPASMAKAQEPAPSALPAQRDGGAAAPGISTCANDGEARRCRSSVNAASG